MIIQQDGTTVLRNSTAPLRLWEALGHFISVYEELAQTLSPGSPEAQLYVIAMLHEKRNEHWLNQRLAGIQELLRPLVSEWDSFDMQYFFHI